MSAAANGYLTDVEYTGQFYAHLAPAWLSYIAAINGYAPPRMDRRLTWCELGCGKGVTSLLLAATHPTGDFYACDFNAAHIAYAERLRSAARVENIRFYPHSIAQMLAADVPPCDFITLHGVYSWVPDAVRAEIREFIQRKLKPGGLVMVSYNAMPGWAHLQPLRRMMQSCAEQASGDSLERARSAFEHLRRLADQGAAYFKANPDAVKHLDDIARQDIRYVAHEYLTLHGDPFYFADVAAAMRGIGLAFAGSMTPADNYEPLMVPAKFQPLLAATPARTMIETQRDFILNATFRQDLYAAQPEVARTPSELSLDRIAGTAFCLTGLPDRLPLKRADGPVQFDLTDQEAAVRSIHALLEDGPATVPSIQRALRTSSAADVSFLIQQLVVSQHLAPSPLARAAPGWMRVNTAIVDTALREQLQQVPLACPHTGSASYCEPVYAATIESAAHLHDAEAASQKVLTRLRTCVHPVNRYSDGGERRPATDDEIRSYVSMTWRNLRDAATPDGKRARLLGVLV